MKKLLTLSTLLLLSTAGTSYARTAGGADNGGGMTIDGNGGYIADTLIDDSVINQLENKAPRLKGYRLEELEQNVQKAFKQVFLGLTNYGFEFKNLKNGVSSETKFYFLSEEDFQNVPCPKYRLDLRSDINVHEYVQHACTIGSKTYFIKKYYDMLSNSYEKAFSILHERLWDIAPKKPTNYHVPRLNALYKRIFKMMLEQAKGQRDELVGSDMDIVKSFFKTAKEMNLKHPMFTEKLTSGFFNRNKEQAYKVNDQGGIVHIENVHESSFIGLGSFVKGTYTFPFIVRSGYQQPQKAFITVTNSRIVGSKVLGGIITNSSLIFSEVRGYVSVTDSNLNSSLMTNFTHVISSSLVSSNLKSSLGLKNKRIRNRTYKDPSFRHIRITNSQVINRDLLDQIIIDNEEVEVKAKE